MPKLATKATLPILDKFQRKRFTLFVSNEDMYCINKMIKSLDDSGLLIDGATETVKHEIKKEVGFLGAMMAPMAASFKHPWLPP